VVIGHDDQHAWKIRDLFWKGKIGYDDAIHQLAAFFTTLKPWKNKRSWARWLTRTYKIRWNHETGFRSLNKVHEQFRYRNPIVQLAELYLRALIHNGWQLYRNQLLKHSIHHRELTLFWYTARKINEKDTSKSKIQQEWVCLYHSYSSGLFSYYDFPILAKTNSPMEQSFGQEKGGIIKQMGRKKVGGQIRIQGENRLKPIYAGSVEIKEIISRIDPDYDKNELREGLLKLSKQTKKEIMLWKNRVFKNNGILTVLNKGK